MVVLKRCFPRGCALTSFEHDSDAVRTEALALKCSNDVKAHPRG